MTGAGWARMALAVVGTLAVTTTAVACNSAGGKERSGEGPVATSSEAVSAGDPEDALGLWVQRRLNLGFVESCDDAKRPDDIGKQCAHLRGKRGDMVAYEVGPTFGEYTQLFILKPVEGLWTIVRQVKRDPLAGDVPGVPWPLQTGEKVIVAGTGECLRVREQPTTQGAEVDCLADGTEVTVGAGPVTADENEWWELNGYGWASSSYLRYPDDAPEVEATEGAG